MSSSPKTPRTWDDIGVPALVAESAHDLLSGYHLALLRPTNEILGSYLARTLQSKGVAYQFHVRANGVTRYGLTHNGIQSVCLPLPPLPEQAAIVRYLDHADRRILRYVTAKRKLIALLEEEKQAVINRAVTRGLDPNVPPQALRRRVARRRARALGNNESSLPYLRKSILVQTTGRENPPIHESGARSCSEPPS